MRHSRLQQKQAKYALEASIKSHDDFSKLGTLLGMVTTAVFLSCHQDPRSYDCARSYQKALGLNVTSHLGSFFFPLREPFSVGSVCSFHWT